MCLSMPGDGIRAVRAGEMDDGQIDKHWASRIVKQVEDTQSSTVAYLREILFSVQEDNQRAIQEAKQATRQCAGCHFISFHLASLVSSSIFKIRVGSNTPPLQRIFRRLKFQKVQSHTPRMFSTCEHFSSLFHPMLVIIKYYAFISCSCISLVVAVLRRSIVHTPQQRQLFRRTYPHSGLDFEFNILSAKWREGNDHIMLILQRMAVKSDANKKAMPL